nr:VEB-PER_beta_lactamase [uncultured bacterium]
MKRPIYTILLTVLISCTVAPANAQLTDLQTQITSISQSIIADIGVAVIDVQSNDTLSVNGNKHFPMQSVFKFHIALAALRQVDEGKLSLDQKYHVTKDHYFNTWSVLMREHPEANVDVTLRELITWCVMNSDNVACDLLFEILGGPSHVDKFIKSLNVNDIAITANERKMHTDWYEQFSNWTTPSATARLLRLFYDGKILKDDSNKFLWKLMADTPNAPNRLKGLLPEGTVVARKPGTGASSEDGVLGAANDVGILVLPNGKKIIVAAFVTNTKEPLSTAEMAIAQISKAVYDYFKK